MLTDCPAPHASQKHTGPGAAWAYPSVRPRLQISASPWQDLCGKTPPETCEKEASTPTLANPGHVHNSVSQARPLCPQPAPPYTSWVASLLHHHDICQLLGPLDTTTTSPHSAITSCALPDASPCTRHMGKWDPVPVVLRWRICHCARAAGSGTCWPCIASWPLLHILGTAHCTPDQSGPTTLLLSPPQKDLSRESCVNPGGSEAVVPPATLKRVHTGQGRSLCKFSALTTYHLGLF